jgi:Rrf2 family protein
MLTKKAKYGLRALVYLDKTSKGVPVLIAQIAKDEGIPQKFLENILLELRNNDILESRRGKGGGYLLRRPLEKVFVGEVLRILDGPLAPVSCVSENFYSPCEDCPDESSCKIRALMKDVRNSISSILDSVTVAQMSRFEPLNSLAVINELIKTPGVEK